MAVNSVIFSALSVSQFHKFKSFCHKRFFFVCVISCMHGHHRFKSLFGTNIFFLLHVCTLILFFFFITSHLYNISLLKNYLSSNSLTLNNLLITLKHCEESSVSRLGICMCALEHKKCVSMSWNFCNACIMRI